MIIATWNVNSVRLRQDMILNFTKKFKVDVLCMQETKTEDKDFPSENFKKAGYKDQYFIGQKSYNGVAIFSKIPIVNKFHLEWCGFKDARHVGVKLKNKITIHNFYVPAGGDIANVTTNLKFKHKLNFLKEMISYFEKDCTKNKILVGDLNIALNRYDVWSHKQLINIVSYTQIERELLSELLTKGNWTDVVRGQHKPDEKLFTWWSYRSKDWKKSNRGRRLDHILTSNDLVKKIKMTKILPEFRDAKKPSDHVPVIAKFEQ